MGLRPVPPRIDLFQWGEIFRLFVLLRVSPATRSKCEGRFKTDEICNIYSRCNFTRIFSIDSCNIKSNILNKF